MAGLASAGLGRHCHDPHISGIQTLDRDRYVVVKPKSGVAKSLHDTAL